MKAKLTIGGHPIHHMLIVFPLGLLATSFFFDLAYLATGRAELATVAWWMIFAGVIGGLAASVFGLIDWLAIPRRTRAWVLGAWHGGGNAIVAVLFAISWAVRREEPGHPAAIAIVLSACGVLLSVITGWFGGELADRMEEV
ncbi:MAG TPA: DUF2231 domain-containing protein [Thermoanaerobaculia bacterium]|nr:DUF2231 domain-containing protein [Thermoanaerobaculia bacterium]